MQVPLLQARVGEVMWAHTAPSSELAQARLNLVQGS